MTNLTAQQARIATDFLGWTLHQGYWFARGQLLTDEPRHLPDLTTFIGRAEWVALLKHEIGRRGWWVTIVLWADGNTADVDINRHDERLAMARGDTELAALTAAILAIMESDE